MVERVAKAVYDADPYYLTYDCGDWLPSPWDSKDIDDDGDEIREVYRKQARAAIAAFHDAMTSEEALKAAGWAVVTSYPDWDKEGDVLTAIGVTSIDFEHAEIAVKAALDAAGIVKGGE